MSFTLTKSKVKARLIYLNSSLRVYLARICKKVPHMVSETYLVDVCDEVGDKYRFGYNGKEKVNEWSGIGNFQDYGFRDYDTRIGRFIRVDPMTSQYPWYTPYQFAGNSPIKFIDLDGLEPAEPGTEAGQYAVANKKGTNNSFGWTWTINKKTGKGSWKQGSSTEYKRGDLNTPSKDGDDNKTYYKDQKVNSIAGNNKKIHEEIFSTSFTAGISLEGESKLLEGGSLYNNFKNGNGEQLSFGENSGMSELLSKDPAFINFAFRFELEALSYYNRKGSLEGFDGSQILQRFGSLYIKDTWFMHTVMGGVQQVNAQIKKVTLGEIQVEYTVWDRFGAGRRDAESKLPGLPSMYWLQHNSGLKNMWTPFTWNIKVSRSLQPNRNLIKFTE